MSIPKVVASAALGKMVKNQMGGRAFMGASLGMAALRVATKSVPGAMLIGTALVLAAYAKKRQANKEAELLESDQQSDYDEATDIA